MTKKLLTLSVTTLIGLLFWLAIPVQGQTDGIIITGADATAEPNIAGDATLKGLVDGIGTRFILYYANGIRTYKVAYFGNDLNDKLKQLPARFVVQYANALKQYPIAFPVGIADDKTAPIASEITHTLVNSTSIKFTWKTNEFATGLLALGEASGAYTRITTDTQFYLAHTSIITGLKANTTYYYKINGVDRSGNSYQTQEFRVNPPTPTPTHMPTPCPTDSTRVDGQCATFTPTPTDPPTPTNTLTPCPTGSVPVGSVCATVTPIPTPPTLTSIRPNQGSHAEPNVITVNGGNFQAGATVTLGGTALTTAFVDAAQLRADVPISFTVGIHDLTVTNPDGGKATLAKAYTVFDAVSNDDLFANDYELVSDPAVPLAGSTTLLRLNVQRQGGKQSLSNVSVRFYLGDPKAGGTVIGDGSVAVLPPNGADNTLGVAWTPPSAQEYTLFAGIDPDNKVTESFENNNQVSRTIIVLPPAADIVAPHVDAFSINDGALTTRDRTVRLNTTASDDAAGTGVAKLLFVEYEFSQGANDWVPVHISDWLDYESHRSNHAWSLVPVSGLKYIQVWVADGAGNISAGAFKQYITFLPPLETVDQNQRQVHRFLLKQGDRLSVRLEPVSGDPDLYIWAPSDSGVPQWVSNLPLAVDDLLITVPADGDYQVQVHGFSAAQYRLIVVINPTEVSAAQPSGGRDPNKKLPPAPLLPNGSAPPDQFAHNSPGITQRSVYLPLIQR